MRRPPTHTVSWTGRPLTPRSATPEQSDRIERADAALALRPDDVERLIAAARVREDVWRYDEAVVLYGRAMAIDGRDYRLPLCRAHRLIRLRALDLALTDLDLAKTLDPTGFNTSYLRGLTLYLMGRFDDAVSEYGGCLDRGIGEADVGSMPSVGDPRQCVVVARDPASRVALTAWLVRALARAGRRREAQEQLEALPSTWPEGGLGPSALYPGSPIVPDDNVHYWALLRYYRGDVDQRSIVDAARGGEQFPTVAYGVAAWALAFGEEASARRLLEEIVADSHWARLGHVAAEADLVRLADESGREDIA